MIATYNFVDILISVVLGLIMLGIGLSLSLNDFTKILYHPKSLITGLIVQMIVLPLIGLILSIYFDLSPELKVGMIILAICPGGTTSGFITYFFKGNVALSISLTTINSLLTLISIPIIVNLSLEYFIGTSSTIRLPILHSILQIFFVTIIPASIGVLIKFKKHEFAIMVEKPVKYIMISLLAIVFIIKIFADKSQGGTGLNIIDIKTILFPSFLLNIFGIIIGYYIAKLLRFNRATSFTIGAEAGLHNTTLAFLVAGTLLHNEEMIKPSLVYAMFSFWVTAIFGYYIMVYRNKENKN
jgi:BASS family bile acid:Na+ symporter